MARMRFRIKRWKIRGIRGKSFYTKASANRAKRGLRARGAVYKARK